MTTTTATSSALPTTSVSASASASGSKRKRILVINGPNLNLLGRREPGIYGSTTLAQIESSLKSRGEKLNITVQTFQANHEGMIVDRIHAAGGFPLSSTSSLTLSDEEMERVDGIIINPAAFTHTSVAVRDALLGINVPFVECHISNVHAREQFRHHSYLSDKAVAVMMGLGVYGYVAALEWWAWRFDDGPTKGI